MIADRLRHWLSTSTGVSAPVLVAAVAALLMLFLSESTLIAFSLWVIYGLLALSLFLVWGHGGMLSLCQTAFFGLAGYTYGVIAINVVSITGESITAVVGGVVLASAVAASFGYFLFYGRLSELYMTVATLVFTLVLYTFFTSTSDPSYAIGSAVLGGYNGMTRIPPIIIGLPGLFSMSLGRGAMYVLAVVLFGVMYILVKFVLRSPFGRVLAAIRENELRCELLGYDIRLIKLLTFTLGGAIAGLAGVMYAAWGRFMTPDAFSLFLAATVIIWLLVGGRNVIWGSLLGVIVVQSVLKALGGITLHAPIFCGVMLVLIVMLFPTGLAGYLGTLWCWFKGRAGVVGAWQAKLRPAPAPPVSGDTGDSSYVLDRDKRVKAPVVDVHDLSISFGGVKALAGVTLKFEPGLCCVIGPNGAGKSTLFNLLVGRFRPATGTILYNGVDITRLKVHQRSRQGVGIKMQIPSIFGHLSVEENVWVAAYAYFRDSHEATVKARKALQQVGLPSDRFGGLAVHLSHGEQQLLELAMVLVSNSKFILLDEPSAGLMRAEKMHMAQLASQLARAATVVVVEHDMEFVRELGAPVTVLHQGQVCAQGSLEQVRQDEHVIDIYLGRHGYAAG